MRKAEISRKTAETDIRLTLALEGTGKCDIDTGVGFLDHMLTLFAGHGCFDLTVKCAGDTCVDDHHSTEDIGIALGQAFAAALGDKKGITRYGTVTLPMDEALVLTAVDLSGRACLRFNAAFPTEKIGSFDTELVQEFFAAFVRSAACTLHIWMMDGENSHHIAEAMFKSFARSMKTAVEMDASAAGKVPSTKGIL